MNDIIRMKELNPCPFCGSEKLKVATRNMVKYIDYHPVRCKKYYVRCDKCLGRGGIADSEEYAILKWNQRVYHGLHCDDADLLHMFDGLKEVRMVDA